VRRRILLVASKTGYQVREFHEAARRLGIDLVLATDRCHVLDNPWGDNATALPFDSPLEEIDIEAVRERGPFDGILAVGDGPALVAARCAERLGLRFHPGGAVNAANDKRRTRERFRGSGMNAPDFRIAGADDGEAAGQRFPCVLKPPRSSASRGVIRADTPGEFAEALARIRKMSREEGVLIEDFIPGREFALEGIVTARKLQTLAIFDKPDPLDGPFFEETIYLTPSRQPASVQRAIREAAQHAVTALGLEFGSVHAEMRVNDRGVWMLEAAARPIGGLCSRVLRFQNEMSLPGGVTLEDVLLRHALGEDVAGTHLEPGAHGVMMIPIPAAGIYSGVEGLEQARETVDIEAVEITAKEGHPLEPLPEGASYLGFLFARAPDAERVERALRNAHACLRFRIAPALSVIR
jgi:biotin carboxylase